MSTRVKSEPIDRKRSGAVTVTPIRAHGRDGWCITHDGSHRYVTTSPSSAATIKEASKLYGRALKRLADR